MYVTVDSNKCQGHLRCLDAAPNVFDADEEGYAVITTPDALVPAQDEDAVRLAARNCPERAITVQDRV